MKKLLFALAIIVALAACNSEPTPKTLDSVGNEVASPGRIKTVSAQEVYASNRGTTLILILLDTKTGQEYLAIEGFGITNMQYVPKVGYVED